MKRIDALVVGGGPGGATAALLLARAGWSVALLERKGFPRKKVCGEYLSATNWPLFRELGIAEEFAEQAGPDVTRVGFFAGKRILESALPRLSVGGPQWGRALSRERLDTILVECAKQAGAAIWQPWSVEKIERTTDGFICFARNQDTREQASIIARIVILAHGSWERNDLILPSPRSEPRPRDLLAFKAHFFDGGLPDGLMPLLAFPRGYGGMVHGENGRFSISCCIRRDRLARIRERHPATTAGDSVQAHLDEKLLGVHRAFQNANRDGPWLASGPIRPGVRLQWEPGIYPVGNLAGEAHPVIAEGISMAMQSAWLLVRELQASPHDLVRVGENYARAWRRSFRPRLRAAAAIARWAMSPLAIAGSLPVLRVLPSLLTVGARLSGKVNRVLPLSAEVSR